MDKIKTLFWNDYATAGIQKKIFRWGAVIITGETARKENASQCSTLSGYAGDFVVATAGPDLRVSLLVKACSHQYSQDHHTSVVNIDIGGDFQSSGLPKEM